MTLYISGVRLAAAYIARQPNAGSRLQKGMHWKAVSRRVAHENGATKAGIQGNLLMIRPPIGEDEQDSDSTSGERYIDYPVGESWGPRNTALQADASWMGSIIIIIARVTA